MSLSDGDAAKRSVGFREVPEMVACGLGPAGWGREIYYSWCTWAVSRKRRPERLASNGPATKITMP